MELNIDSLQSIREGLARVTEAGDFDEALDRLNEIGGQGSHVIEDLRKLSQSDWDELRSALEQRDRELARLVTSVRGTLEQVTIQQSQPNVPFSFSSRIVQVSCAPFMHLESGRPIIRILFETADEKTFFSDQDFEDTLAIGLGILRSVAETGRMMSKRFEASFHNIALGDALDERLEMIQSETREIQRLCARRMERKGKDAEENQV